MRCVRPSLVILIADVPHPERRRSWLVRGNEATACRDGLRRSVRADHRATKFSPDEGSSGFRSSSRLLISTVDARHNYRNGRPGDARWIDAEDEDVRHPGVYERAALSVPANAVIDQTPAVQDRIMGRKP